MPVPRPTKCEMCQKNLKQFSETDDRETTHEYPISTDDNTPFCPVCDIYYCFCVTCQNGCEFLGVEVDRADVQRIQSRDPEARIVPARFITQDPLFRGPGSNGFPILLAVGTEPTRNYVSTHEMQFLTGEKITGGNGGLYSFWFCKNCDKKFSVTDK